MSSVKSSLQSTRCLRLANELGEIVVADTSVVINLNATGCADRILGSLPFAVVTTDIVAAELQEDRRSGRNDAALVASLIDAQLMRTVSLGTPGEQAFIDLVIGQAADTLDDGEASTLAYAIEHAIRPVIDERKALRICAQRFAHLRPMSTVNLLMDRAVAAVLGHDAHAEAVFRALSNARMRVMADQVGWVVELIGANRASQCPSLPAAFRRG